MAELLNIDGEDPGLEIGGTPWEWDSVTNDGDGTFALDTDAAIHGVYGYSSIFTGSGDAYGEAAFTETSTVYVRWYFEIDSYGYSNDNYVTAFDILDGLNSCVTLRYYCTPTNNTFGYRLYTNNGGTLLLDRDEVDLFVIGTQYCIEIKYVSDGVSGGAEVRIDGVSEASDFTQNTSSYVPDGIRLGPYAGTLVSGDRFYWDDVVVADGAIGELTTTTTTAAPSIVFPVFSSRGIHSSIFGGQVING